MNAAGKFRSLNPIIELKKQSNIIKKITEIIQKFIINLSFIYTKQPKRIEQVLRQVYPINPSQVDSDLVSSIQYPSTDPNAPEVFYRVVSKNGNGPSIFIDDLLLQLNDIPLLLLWGIRDPWIRPSSADMIQSILPGTQRVDLNAGHCPHDETPDEINEEIYKFMKSIHK